MKVRIKLFFGEENPIFSFIKRRIFQKEPNQQRMIFGKEKK